MADTAFLTLYRNEWQQAYERSGATMLRNWTTRELMVQGRDAVFLVAGSGREMRTRGQNGLIPAASDDLTQITVRLEEEHDLSQKINFNIFAGQANQREIMRQMSFNTLNRAIDDKIIDELNTATQDTGTASIMTKRLISNALTILGNNDVPDDGQIYGLLTPAAWAHLTDDEKFANMEWVSASVLDKPAPQMFRYQGITFMKHTGLPGKGTASAKCFIWHKSAVGHAMGNDDNMIDADYNREHAYYWVRHSVYHGAETLQSEGIVVINHDDTAYSAVS